MRTFVSFVICLMDPRKRLLIVVAFACGFRSRRGWSPRGGCGGRSRRRRRHDGAAEARGVLRPRPRRHHHLRRDLPRWARRRRSRVRLAACHTSLVCRLCHAVRCDRKPANLGKPGCVWFGVLLTADARVWMVVVWLACMQVWRPSELAKSRPKPALLSSTAPSAPRPDLYCTSPTHASVNTLRWMPVYC